MSGQRRCVGHCQSCFACWCRAWSVLTTVGRYVRLRGFRVGGVCATVSVRARGSETVWSLQRSHVVSSQPLSAASMTATVLATTDRMKLEQLRLLRAMGGCVQDSYPHFTRLGTAKLFLYYRSYHSSVLTISP